jgi:serine/threonine-protein kinase
VRQPQANHQATRDDGVVLDNKFRVLAELGMRDDEVVYAGLHLGTERHVELRLLPSGITAKSPEADRMLRAARAAGRVPHKNILSVVDSGTDQEGRPFIVYEQFSSLTAAELIKQEGPLSAREAGEVMCQVLEALAALHDRGVVHRFVRPECVRIERAESGQLRAKLSGFSHAFTAGKMAQVPELPRGFSRFLAPEARRGESSTTPPIDIYAAGVLMRFLLAGDTDPNADLDPKAARAIARATASEPEERFLTATHFLSAVSLLVPEGGNEDSLPPPDPLAADLKYMQQRRARESGVNAAPTGEGRLELYPVLMMVETVYGRLGANGWRELLSEAPEAEQLLPSAGRGDYYVAQGVSVELVSRMLATADRLGASGDLSWLAEVGEAMVRRGLARFCPQLPSQLSPEVLVDCVREIWGSMSRHGEVVVLERHPQGARIGIRAQVEPSLEVCAVMAGLLRAQLRALSPQAEVSTVACQALGDAADIFVLSWS